MKAFWLGRVEYEAAWQLQRELAALRADRQAGDVLLLLEHPPVITVGRGGREAHILASGERLRQLGVSLQRIDRGGDVTYHGPGQLVGYPIVHLADHRPDLHWFLRRMEEALIEALAAFSLSARRFPQHTGVWVDSEKIAAIGIKVSRWVTTHGFALNVDPQMSHFDLIVPCGIRDYGVTSMRRLLDRPVALTEVLPPVCRAFTRLFGRESGVGIPLQELTKTSQKILREALDAGGRLC